MINGPIAWLRRLSGRAEFDCDDVHENSSEYVDEELSPSVSNKFRAHMDSCTDCNIFVATFRATVMTLRDLPRRPASNDLQDRIRERISVEPDGFPGQDPSGGPQGPPGP